MADDTQRGDGDISEENPTEETTEESGKLIDESKAEVADVEISQKSQENQEGGNEFIGNLLDEQEIETTVLENGGEEGIFNIGEGEIKEKTDVEGQIIIEEGEVLDEESTEGDSKRKEEAESTEDKEKLEKEEIIEGKEVEEIKPSEEKELERDTKPEEEDVVEGEEPKEGGREVEEVNIVEQEVLQEGEEKPEVVVKTKLEEEGKLDEVKLLKEEELKEGEGEPERKQAEAAEEDKEKAEGRDIPPEKPKRESVVSKVGDFIVKKQASFEDIALTPEIELEYSSSSEEEEEEEEEVEEEEEEYIDREALINQYKVLQLEARPIVKRNVFLLKKLAEHFKKRKMEHVYKQPELYSADKELKYHKQLLAFEEVRKAEASERDIITKELQKMTNQRDVLASKMKEEIENLIQKERLIGIGLISTRTGKVIPDRVVENLLSRQKRKMKELSEVRLCFIKLRDKVAIKEAQLRALETLGENLHLVDYEQLKIQNQSLADKIEERDEELQNLRNKAKSAMLIMAHMREKSHATDEKMDELCDVLDYTRTEVNNTRGYVTDVKKRRDRLRSETLRLRQQAGLLVHPRLLRHFEKSIEEATQLSAEVQNLRNDFYDQKRKLAKIRTDITELGGNVASFEESLPPGSLPPVTETQKITFSGFTPTGRRKSMKVTQSLLNQLSSADNTRRLSMVRRAPRSIATTVKPITKDRPSFFPSVTRETFRTESLYGDMDSERLKLPSIEEFIS